MLKVPTEQFDLHQQYKRIEIPLNDHKLAAYSLGSGENVLFMIHGGPGFPSNYLQDSHACFAKRGFRVITWDQLGCGKSDKPSDLSLWQLARFVEEVETVRKFFGIDQFHLLGQSWGGVLGLEYCLTYQKHVKSFIMANTSPSIPLMNKGFERLRGALGEESSSMLTRRESEGTTDHPEYQAATTILFYRHICRTEEWTLALKDCCSNVAKPVWNEMFGNAVLKCDGNLKDWDRSSSLDQIKVPTLIVHGEFDEIVPECAELAHKGIANSQFELFKGCSHMPFYENPEKYQRIVEEFLRKFSI
jgi:proline iminopeptidase